jgi:succinate-semialdehyde dehydrogenase/glutarate-semialdehyde dehydrogenase
MNCMVRYKTVEQGGRLVLGGIIPEGKVPLSGNIIDLEPGMEAFDNEIGPAASVMRAKDDAHAVELANIRNLD